MAETEQRPLIVAVASVRSVKVIDGGHMIAVELERGDGSLVALLIPTKMAPDLIANLSAARGEAEQQRVTHVSESGRRA